MKLLSIIFILVLSFSVFSQKRVADLQPAHAAALEAFLSKNKDYGFMSENVLDDENLLIMP